jgi:hypothetical protein
MQPAPGSATEALVLEVLIRMTLDGSFRRRIREVKRRVRRAANDGDPQQALKIAVQQALARTDPRYAELTCDQLQQVAADYSDRVVVGVDYWHQQDKTAWKRVCNQVTDLSSSDI